MAFFENIKEKLENKLTDFTTIEHVLIFEDDNSYIYRFQQTAGDSLSYISEKPIDKEYYLLFNKAFSASVESRTSITRFIIECLTK